MGCEFPAVTASSKFDRLQARLAKQVVTATLLRLPRVAFPAGCGSAVVVQKCTA